MCNKYLLCWARNWKVINLNFYVRNYLIINWFYDSQSRKMEDNPFIMHPLEARRARRCRQALQGMHCILATFVIGYYRLLQIIMMRYLWKEFDWAKEWGLYALGLYTWQKKSSFRKFLTQFLAVSLIFLGQFLTFFLEACHSFLELLTHFGRCSLIFRQFMKINVVITIEITMNMTKNMTNNRNSNPNTELFKGLV